MCKHTHTDNTHTHFFFLRHDFFLPPVSRLLCSESREIPVWVWVGEGCGCGMRAEAGLHTLPRPPSLPAATATRQELTQNTLTHGGSLAELASVVRGRLWPDAWFSGAQPNQQNHLFGTQQHHTTPAQQAQSEDRQEIYIC